MLRLLQIESLDERVGARLRVLVAITILGAMASWVAPAQVACAQDEAETPPGEASDMEGPDPTRLDVERLPPEAIEVTRDMYARGGFLEAHFGARWFVGSAGSLGSVAGAGPLLRVGGGYQFTRWFMAQFVFQASLHGTDAPRPPAAEIFEIYDALLSVRIQANLSARAALFLDAEVGLSWTTADVLRTYGLRDADRAGLSAGGQVGFDWHMRNRHNSMGIAGGAHVYPNLVGAQGGVALGIHTTAYMRYVF